MNQKMPLDIADIQQILPHRFPFLLLDRILELEPGKFAKALKNVTISEPFFQGHFPSQAIMPGVLIIEAMAQLGGVLLLQQEQAAQFADGNQHQTPQLALLTGVDKARFRKQVVPGDQLILVAEIKKIRGKMGKLSASASVDQQRIAEAELMFCLVDSNA